MSGELLLEVFLELCCVLTSFTSLEERLPSSSVEIKINLLTNVQFVTQ